MPKPTRPLLVSDDDLNNAIQFIEGIPIGERCEAIQAAWYDAQSKLKETRNMCIITHALYAQHPNSDEVKVELIKRVNLYEKFAEDVVIFKNYLDSLTGEKKVFNPVMRDAETGVIVFPTKQENGE
jgi:hypothetical protein